MICLALNTCPHTHIRLTCELNTLRFQDMSLQLEISVLCLSLIFLEASSLGQFGLTVPNVPVLGLYGQAVVLPCVFPVDSGWTLSSTVITWQRGLDVIHSFYYNQDQLDHQNPGYANRTSLFLTEIVKGNASLRLSRTTLQDAGLYTCIISTNKGRQRKSLQVDAAAYYSEPRLEISVSSGGVKLLVTSQGGFPAPSLRWMMENIDITNQTQTRISRDSHTGLYSVSSWIVFTEATNSSLVFFLHNHLLQQNTTREIRLFSDKSDSRGLLIERTRLWILPFAVVLLLVLILVCISKNKGLVKDSCSETESIGKC